MRAVTFDAYEVVGLIPFSPVIDQYKHAATYDSEIEVVLRLQVKVAIYIEGG